ncbi:MAG: metallophosphoesterase, partial [Chitinophagales bacterium]
MKHKNLTLVIIVGTLALSLTTIFLTNRSSNQRLAMNTQAATVSTEANLKVAFMGDAALGKTAEDVLTLIKNESAAAVVHVGDFEYKNNPGAFDAQIQKILGTSIPYFGVPGNHDTANWSGTGGYKEVLSNRSGSFCTGDYGSQAYCNFKGLGLMLLGVGTTVSKDNAAQMNFIKTAAASNTWKICNWHKNQNAMQIGGKGDEVGWGAFEACREAGAIIMSGHEYSYERTKTLISTTNQTVDPSCNSVTAPCIGPGKAIVIVTGLAGASMRDQQRCLPAVAPYGCKGEWAKIYSTTQGSVHGALFMVFNYNGDPNKAHGYFKNVNGQVIDDFVVTAAGGTGGPTATPGSGIPSNTPSAGCAKRSQGDANCDNAIDITDFEIFRKEYTGQLSTKSADYDGDGSVTVADFEAWRKGYFGISASTTSTTGISPTISSTSPTPTRTTTNTPQQVSKGIWISTEEIAKLPMSGSGWTNVKAAADSNWGSANLGDNDSPHDILTLAGALVAVRTNNAAMRSKTIAGLNSAMQSPLTRALELGRGLQTYIIAADIIGYRDAAFMSWVQKMVHVK